MFKTILSLMLLVNSIAFLAGQQLRTEKVGDLSNIILMLPYSEFHGNVGTNECHYDLNTDIQNARKTIIQHQIEELDFIKPEAAENEYYPLFYRTNLAPGKYTFFMKLQNRILGDHNEKKFTFTIPEESKKISSVMLVGDKKNARIWIRDLAKMPSDIDSLKIVALVSIVPDSVKLYVAEGDSSRVYNLKGKQVIDEEIGRYLLHIENPIIKLQVFSQNVKYTKNILYNDSVNSFATKYSLEDQILQLRYIMNQNELNFTRTVKPEQYRSFIENFWKSKDPTPDTKRNEFRETFEERVMEADRLYSIKNYRPGWKTDLGKVFIKYGQPDEVVSDPIPINRPPYIIWYYYTENKVFQFYDLDGWGNYKLGAESDE